ncbi:hypothetical protein [Lacticaseibacillus pantheris]|nr:hypothetical protein [Lacticaseibacillus pantheris]
MQISSTSISVPMLIAQGLTMLFFCPGIRGVLLTLLALAESN